ncbi:MAG: TolC family protein [Thermodesulfobacteriota bacterium]
MLSLPTHAQELSLRAALDRASIQATELQRLQKQQQLARATHSRSAQAYLPRISAESTWMRADADALAHIPSLNLRATPPITTHDYGPVEGVISGINIVQPLIHVEGWMGHTQAGSAARASAAATEWGTQMLKLKTAQTYFGVHTQGAVLHAAQQASHAARQALESATANYSQGMVSKLDVSRARAEAQNAQARVFAAESELNKAKNHLASLLGIDPAEPFRVTTPLPDPIPPAEYPLPQQQRADITASKLMLKSRSAGVDKAKARILPKVNLLARQQWVNGDSALEDYGDAWLVGVNLEWNLFEGLDRRGDIAEAKAHADLAQVENTEKKRTAAIEQSNSWNDWVASWKGWEASRTAVEAAETAANLAKRRYAEGLGNLTDVLLTRAELFQTQVKMCRYQYQTLLAGMSYYLHHGYNPVQGLPPQLR